MSPIVEVSVGYNWALNQCQKLVPWKKIWRFVFRKFTGTMLSKATTVRERRQQNCVEELNNHTVTTKALASPNRCSGAGMAL